MKPKSVSWPAGGSSQPEPTSLRAAHDEAKSARSWAGSAAAGASARSKAAPFMVHTCEEREVACASKTRRIGSRLHSGQPMLCSGTTWRGTEGAMPEVRSGCLGA